MRGSKLSRRQFTFKTLAITSAATLPGLIHATEKPPRRYRFCAFTKFLGEFDYQQLSDRIAEAGFDGIEVTARKQESYIHPERAADELPALSDALRRNGLEIMILTTDILRAEEPHAESLLRTAKQLGVPRYRLGFFQYDLRRPVLSQLRELQPVIRDLVDLNREVGIAAIYQNHCSPSNVGATFWDLHSLIKDFPPSEIGNVFDIRHAAVEGGESWPVYYNLIRPHVTALSVKDFDWDGRRSRHVPLGQGRVDPIFFKWIRESDFAGPISVHVEYLREATAAENVAALQRDLLRLQEWLKA